MIEYASTGRRRGWWKKYVIIGVLFALALSGAYKWRTLERLYATTQAWLWQRRAMKHTFPNRRIVYTDDPAEIAKLGEPVTGAPITYDVPALRQMELWISRGSRLQFGPAPRGIVFLHGRRAGKREFLVAVSAVPMFYRGGDGFRVVDFMVTIYSPGSPLRYPQQERRDLIMAFPLGEGERFTIFAGTADPRDSAHFTLAYMLNGVRGSIDGRMRSGGDVVLHPDKGVIWSSPGNTSSIVWQLSAAASRPSKNTDLP